MDQKICHKTQADDAMLSVTEEVIQRAREMDKLIYLEASEPHKLLRSRKGEYRKVTQSSLKVYGYGIAPA